MVRNLFMGFVFAMVLSSVASAEVLVLNNNFYIDHVRITNNQDGVVTYERFGDTFRMHESLIKGVAASRPQGGQPADPAVMQNLVVSMPAGDKQREESLPDESTEKPESSVDTHLAESGGGRLQVDNDSFTIGFLNGGGSLIGVDYQVLLENGNVALQFGAGMIGFDVGLNYYFYPDIHSSYLSLAFLNQGDFSTYARYIGLTLGIKAFGWLNAQIGVGRTIDVSENMRQVFQDQGYDEVPSVLLLYSLGVYF